MTDIDYIRGFKENDEKVISVFYKSVRPAFCAFIKGHYSKDDAYVVDLFQESCVALWKNIQHGKLTEDERSSSLSTYLFAIGRNTLMAKDRKFKPFNGGHDLTPLFTIEDDGEEARKQRELEDFVYRMVGEMKPPCDKLLKAQYWDKLSGQEIARKYGFKNADSVKTQKSKCIQKLRPLIEEFARI